MKKSRLTTEQIVSMLNEAATKEKKRAEICRKHGITEQTYYRWRRAAADGKLPRQVHSLRNRLRERR